MVQWERHVSRDTNGPASCRPRTPAHHAGVHHPTAAQPFPCHPACHYHMAHMASPRHSAPHPTRPLAAACTALRDRPRPTLPLCLLRCCPPACFRPRGGGYATTLEAVRGRSLWRSGGHGQPTAEGPQLCRTIVSPRSAPAATASSLQSSAPVPAPLMPDPPATTCPGMLTGSSHQFRGGGAPATALASTSCSTALLCTGGNRVCVWISTCESGMREGRRR
jgi:hypothetical protein